MKKINVLIIVLFLYQYSSAQSRWPIPFFLPNYGVYLKITNDVELNDTAKISISQNTYLKLIFFDSRGKSYCEVYRNNKLYEKGYYENSLDTLKRYSSAATINRRSANKISIIQYFQPIKNGEWLESRKGKLIKRIYKEGVLVTPIGPTGSDMQRR